MASLSPITPLNHSWPNFLLKTVGKYQSNNYFLRHMIRIKCKNKWKPSEIWKVKIHMNVESRGNELRTEHRLHRESSELWKYHHAKTIINGNGQKIRQIIRFGKHSLSCIDTFRLMIRPLFYLIPLRSLSTNTTTVVSI